MTELNGTTYGVELEKAFTAADGDSHGVGAAYFGQLQALQAGRGESADVQYIGDTPIGVTTSHGSESLDNGFNLGESSTGPITGSEGGLTKLHEVTQRELCDVAAALSVEGAAILSMSNHPLATVDQASYDRFVVPKPGYAYARNVRGWNHRAGINASAQNSPSTGVSAYEAAAAVNAMIGLGSAMVAMYANSPFSEGKVTDHVETRSGMWEKIFRDATQPGDRRMHQPPTKPFDTMRDYFVWMFGPGSNMFFVPQALSRDARVAEGMVNVDGDPSMLEYLAQPQWTGRLDSSGELTTVRPTLGHLAMHQFLQFSGARARFRFRDEAAEPSEFLAAMGGRGTEVETFMDEACDSIYIEGRDPGANFVDRELLDMVGQGAITDSVVISPSAIQAGLLNNLQGARRLLDTYGWGTLMGLRSKAPRFGVDAVYGGVTQAEVCEAVLQVAADGLDPSEQWMLAYPEFVLRTGLSGAARARAAYEERPETSETARIRAVVRDRRAIIRDTI